MYNIYNIYDMFHLNLAEPDLDIFDVPEEYRKLFQSIREGNVIRIGDRLYNLIINHNVKDKFGRTPLHWAVMGGRTYVAGLISDYIGRDAPALLNARDNYGRTPLDWAALLGGSNLVEYVFGLPEEYQRFFQFIMEGNIEGIREYPYDFIINPNVKDKFGRTPLHWAVMGGHIDVVQFIYTCIGCNAPALLNVKDEFDRAPLHYAAILGKDDLVGQVLCINNNFNLQANIDVQDSNGDTPLHLAAKNGHTAAVNMLIELIQWCAAENSPTHNNRNLIDIASSYGKVTPLHQAAKNGHTDIVRPLLEFGADINVHGGFFGKIPLHLAVMGGYTEIVQIITDAMEARPTHVAGEASRKAKVSGQQNQRS